MKRFGLSPRRVMLILLLMVIGYWLLHYSDWAKAIGVVQPLIFGAEDIGPADEEGKHP